MKKVKSQVAEDDIRAEYDFSGGVRGRYYERSRQGSNLVLLEPDVAAAFPNSKSVNQALRALASIGGTRHENEDGGHMGPDVLLKQFETPDEVRLFEKGRLELVRLGTLVLGRAIYEPGWKWSMHVGPTVGATHCMVEHVGMVLSGVATVAFQDGRVVELTEGSLFHVPAVPHDSWVVGEGRYVSLHFLGADQYAKK